MVGTVVDLRLYPVKGLRGRSVAAARVDPWGFEGDRRWLVVDEAGLFMTQRRHPAMATITAEPTRTGLLLKADGYGALDVAIPDRDDAREEVTVWNDHIMAMSASVRAAAWLTDILGTKCRMVYMDRPETARRFRHADDRLAGSVSFADAYPVLVTTTSSLGALQAAVGSAALTMDQFRSNIVVDTRTAWDEECWRRTRCGDLDFAVAKACTRCVVITLDPQTGEPLPRGEPLRTLAAMRRDAAGRPIFGQNLVPLSSGVIRIGDPVSVLDRTG